MSRGFDKTWRDLSPELQASLRAAYQAGAKVGEIAALGGISRVSARHNCDDEYRRNHLEADKIYRAKMFPKQVQAPIVIRAKDIEVHLANMPLDTRSITGRLMGDPIEGRERQMRWGQ